MSSAFAERRMARQRRILENSEKRMNIILTGDDGEKRSEPGLEDGPIHGHKLMFSDDQSSAAANDEGPSSESDALFQEKPSAKQPQQQRCVNNNEQADYPDLRKLRAQTWNETATAQNKPYKRPRILLAAVIGVIYGLLNVLLGLELNMTVVWCVYQASMECLHYYVHFHVNNAPPYPPHRHIVNVMLWIGVNEEVTKIFGRLEETLARAVDDTVAMLVCFFAILSIASL